MSIDQLYPAQLERVYERLPPEFIALLEDYPFAIANAAEGYGKPRLEEGASPETLDIYLAQYTGGPAISYREGVVYFDPNFWVENAHVRMVEWNSEWVYVQIGALVVLDLLPHNYELPSPEQLKLSAPGNET